MARWRLPPCSPRGSDAGGLVETADMDHDEHQNEARRVWPLTYSWEWCGEYQKDDPQAPAVSPDIVAPRPLLVPPPAMTPPLEHQDKEEASQNWGQWCHRVHDPVQNYCRRRMMQRIVWPKSDKPHTRSTAIDEAVSCLKWLTTEHSTPMPNWSAIPPVPPGDPTAKYFSAVDTADLLGVVRQVRDGKRIGTKIRAYFDRVIAANAAGDA